MPPDDRKLIGGFLTGDLECVSQMEKWIAAAAKPFRTRLGDEWEDLRQDILTELTRLFSESRFRGESALVSYVWRIANNACLKRIRAAARWAPDVTDLLNRTRDTRKTAAEKLLDQDRLESIRRLVLQMPPECTDLWRRILAGSELPIDGIGIDHRGRDTTRPGAALPPEGDRTARRRKGAQHS